MFKGIITGQINFFDVPSEKPQQENNTKRMNVLSNVDIAINQYSESCRLIAKLKVGGTVIYLNDRVMYFNREGQHERDYDNFLVFPNSEILVANEESKINKSQITALDKLDPEEYILRKGDNNIYIPSDRGIKYIDENGQVWDINMKLKTNNLHTTVHKKEKSFSKGQKVIVCYEGKKQAGEVWSIYNDGNTINVLFKDKMQIQPWYKGYVERAV